MATGSDAAAEAKYVKQKRDKWCGALYGGHYARCQGHREGGLEEGVRGEEEGEERWGGGGQGGGEEEW